MMKNRIGAAVIALVSILITNQFLLFKTRYRKPMEVSQ